MQWEVLKSWPHFAERFVQAGFVVMVFDYRYMGASDGKPRSQLIPHEQHEDYCNQQKKAFFGIELTRPKKMVQRHNDQEDRPPGCDRKKRIHAKQVQTAGYHL